MGAGGGEKMVFFLPRHLSSSFTLLLREEWGEIVKIPKEFIFVWPQLLKS